MTPAIVAENYNTNKLKTGVLLIIDIGFSTLVKH
jgi:hypothetical protein